MASSGKSRWGSLLSQAVAGVEARLDTILADEESTAPKSQEGETKPPPSPSKPSPGVSRAASTNRTNDRLQERLARAMAAKAAQKADAARGSISNHTSPRQSLDVQSRASTDSAAPGTPDLIEEHEAIVPTRTSSEVAPQAETPAQTIATGEKEASKPLEANQDEESSNEKELVIQLAPSAEQAMGVPIVEPQPMLETEVPSDTIETSQIRGLEKSLEEVQLLHQEETHGYVERIDALEAKLQFLAREATESARKAALAAPAGSAEKKLAEKDQQIAQLMEEGKNLASTEQKHRTIMKKLRAKIAEDEKIHNNLKGTKNKTDRELDDVRRKAQGADELDKEYKELQKKYSTAQRELNTLRPEVETKNNTIVELQAQLHKATGQANAMTAKVNDQAREQDKQRIAGLEESVAALQVEKSLVADRAKIRENGLREKLERATERSRALELEMRAEVQVMESKLEAMRTRNEETSSGAIGDSQAKLLRQVETLQTQYSIAGENWQGIETTLQARITNLEKERDEALQRESDMRKKAREAAVRAKRNEEELEDMRTKLPSVQEDVKSSQGQIDALEKQVEEAETALSEARMDFEKQRQAWKEESEEKLSRPPTDRRSWLEDLSANHFKSDSRPESPLLSAPQRTLSSDLLGIQSASRSRKPSAPSANNSDAGAGSGSLRRPSAQPPLRPSIFSQSSNSIHTSFSPTVDALPTPSVHPLEREDAFEGIETASSPRQILQDMLSVSTVAAGPSVQLVERMSAAIRRLESEKMAAREELTRISSQRDEARAEIVAMMRAVETNKSATERVKALEVEVADVNARYETTLELLGEKSEQVDELRADVQDMKEMYRELVERTIK